MKDDMIIFVWEEIKAWSTQSQSLKRSQEKHPSIATPISKMDFIVPPLLI